MAVPFLNSITLNKNEVQDFKVYNIGTGNPTLSSGGDIGYFWTDTTGSKVLKWWDGSAVRTILDSSSTTVIAADLSGGAAGSLPYQQGANDTTFLGIGTADQVLKVNSGATAPEWVSQSTLAVGSATNKPGGALGDLLVQSGSGTTTFLNVGTVGQVLTSNGASPAYVNQSSLSVGSATTATTADKVANALTAGTYLTAGGTFDGATARTFAVDATDANTASKVVARDGSGNFSAGTITASLSGNASTATNVSGGAAGELLYQSGLATTAKLGVGTDGYILTYDGTNTKPKWSASIPAGSVSGLAASATTDTTNASNISSGTLPLARLALATGQFYVGDASNNPAATAKSSISLTGFGALTADLDIAGFNIINSGNVTSGSTGSTLATKGYVDSVAQGLDIKASCLVGTIANIDLTAPGSSIDGISLDVDDRVLVKDQTNKTQNGIYLWKGAAVEMVRSPDANTIAELVSAFTFVERGTNADSGWVCQVDSGTIGSVDIVWTKFSQAGSYTAGNGMVLVGGQFSFATSNPYTTGEIPYAYSSNEIRFKAVTGTGDVVLATSPTLVTPALGVATATSINKLTITAPATGSTLTIADGKTLTASNTLTFTGTDSSSVDFGAGGTVAYTGGTLAQFAATTSSQLAGVISDETGTGALVFANTPTFVTPILGTPTSGTLTNCTDLPVSTGVSGLGTGVSTFLATPTSANLLAAVTDETGTGSLVFATSPTLAGTPLSTTAAADTNTTQIATTAFVIGQAASTNPSNLGPVAVGTSLKYARADHVHAIPTIDLTANVTGTLPIANGGTGATSFTAGRVLFGGTSAINTSANLFWDNTNSRLGIGTATPAAKFDLSAGTNLNLRMKQLALDNWANEGIGITMTRTSDDGELIALGVIDTNKLGVFSREGIVFSVGGAALYSQTSQAMFLDPSGNLGLGVTPSGNYKLEVAGGIGVGVASSSTYIVAKYNNELIAGVDSTGYYFASGNNTTSNIPIYVGDSASAIVFKTSASTSAGTERFRIKSTGQLNLTGLAADPTGAAGDLYYSTGNYFKYHNGTAWQTFPRKYFTALAGSNTTFDVDHNLNSREVTVMVRKTASPYDQVFTDVKMTTENKVQVVFASTVSGADYTVTVIG